MYMYVLYQCIRVHYRNGSFIHGINISLITILVNIHDFIFTNLLAS